MCKDVTISEIKEAQRICLERGIPFFAYRLPDSGNFCFGAQISGEVAGNCSPSVFLEDSGFLFSPFHVANNSLVRFLRNDIDLSKAGDLDILKVTPKKNVPDTVPVGEIGKDIYIKQAERIISVLRSGKIRKAVLSRVKQSFCDPYKKAPEWFNGLCETYPDAFVFLVSIPGDQIAEELEKLGHKVDRKIIVVKDAVKEVGSYKAIVKLHKEVSVEIPFEVVAE